MTESHIDYDAKVQDALRSVVKNVLIDTAKEGLQGEHHFYIAFKTQADGVNIPAHLVSRFPDEMTIVLQHKFWGLEIHDDRFEIGLSFNQKPEHLIVPFDAIVGFVDPSVQFALQFHDESDVDPADDDVLTAVDAADDGMFLPEDTQDVDPEENSAGKSPAVVEEDHASGEEDASDNVVALDAFRKK